MAAAKRLMHEFKQIQRSPVPLAGASPLEGNIFKWKAVVVGPAPYDFPVRVELQYPEDYPNTPPSAFFETFINYVAGAAIPGKDGRTAVCLNIFGNFSHIHTEWKTQQEGWSPAYTIETILVSLQALLSSDMLSRRPQDVERACVAAVQYHCKETGHDGSDPTKYWPPLGGVGSAPPATAAASSVVNDAGVAVAAACVEAEKEAEEQHYVCYATKMPGGALGFGVQLENPRNGTFSSPCEFLSAEAFNEGGVRNSSTNKPFGYWVPVVTPYASWKAIEAEWHRCVGVIAHGTKGVLPRDAALATLKLCTSVMGSLVVEIMNAKNNLTANDRFIDGYFAFTRILRCVAATTPSMVTHADRVLGEFIADPKARAKASVPNLGEFLLLLLVSRKYKWGDVCDAFAEECDARNVFWYVVGNASSPPSCPDLVNPAVGNRATRVFAATPVSRCVVCYQVRFLQLAAALDVAAVDANRGLLPADVRAAVKGMYAAITGIKSWAEHFTWLQMGPRTDAVREKELVAALEASKAAGYHGLAGGGAGGRGGFSGAPNGRGGRGGGFGGRGRY